MKLDELHKQNIWWLDATRVDADPVVQAMDASTLRWRPVLEESMQLGSDRIYTLRGPRQVGKTTLLKTTVRELLRSGIEPMSVLYLSCDMVRDDRGLLEALEMYKDVTRELPRTTSRVLLIDEISSVEGWERAIKHLADLGDLRGCAIVLTGSHSMDIKHSAERLPGRRGEGAVPLDLKMYPMRFSEYLATVDPSLWGEAGSMLEVAQDGRRGVLLRLLSGEIDEVLRGRFRLLSGQMRAHLDDYLLTGGMIRAVREHALTGAVGPGAYDVFMRSMVGDLARWRLQERIAKQVLAAVVQGMTTRVSLSSMADRTELGSHNTVSRYLEALEDSFVLRSVYQLDLAKGRPKYRSERKVYFQDPFMYHATRGWIMGAPDLFALSREALIDTAGKGRLVEMVVGEHLARLVGDLKPGDFVTHHESLLHWRKKGSVREVDFALDLGDGYRPVEVKYQGSISGGDVAGLRSFRGGVVVSRDTMETRHGHAIIPAELFLALF